MKLEKMIQKKNSPRTIVETHPPRVVEIDPFVHGEHLDPLGVVTYVQLIGSHSCLASAKAFFIVQAIRIKRKGLPTHQPKDIFPVQIQPRILSVQSFRSRMELW